MIIFESFCLFFLSRLRRSITAAHFSQLFGLQINGHFALSTRASGQSAMRLLIQKLHKTLNNSIFYFAFFFHFNTPKKIKEKRNKQIY
jgi:hypothetical protein